MFDFSSDQDFKNSTQVIAELDQDGLGLPDRDYYVKTDPKSVELRQGYVAHVQKCSNCWASRQPLLQPMRRP